MALYQNRIVIKIGTTTLMNEMDRPDLKNTEKLVRTVADAHNMGFQVILVSSGAIAFGTERLGLKVKPSTMRMQQAVAAVGQSNMMNLYDRLFAEYGKTTAQILLGAEDIDKEETRRNLTNTLETLIDMDVIPIANENDSLNNEEIGSGDAAFGDNDMLSAVVASLCRASKLIILSDRSVLESMKESGGNSGRTDVRSKTVSSSARGRSGAWGG